MAKPALTGATFYHQVNQLWQCTKGKPQDPFRSAVPLHQQLEHHEFPLQAEIDLAEAIAYIAAVKKGVESVSASAISVPNDARHELLIYIASNDGIQTKTESSLRTLFSIIEQSIVSTGSNRNGLRDQILEIVLTLNNSRINKRLKKSHGNRQIVLRGLQEVLQLVRQRVSQDGRLEVLADRLLALCQSVRTHNFVSKSTTSTQHHKDLVMACFEFWEGRGPHSTSELLRRAGVDIDESRGNPHLRQIAKIAAYEHVTRVLVTHASHRQYGHLFRHVTLRFVPAHATILIVPETTNISCYNRYRVHAEVQLVMDIDGYERSRWQSPRALGSSKAACFLCDLFIHKHVSYFVPRGHGVLTKYWAIPDHNGFTRAQRQRYQHVVQAMTLELLRLTKTNYPHRVDPAMSWQALSRLGQLRLSEQSSRVPTPSHLLHAGTVPFTRGPVLLRPLSFASSRPISIGVPPSSTDGDGLQNPSEMSGQLHTNVEAFHRTEFDLQTSLPHTDKAQLVTNLEQSALDSQGASLILSGQPSPAPITVDKIGTHIQAVVLPQSGSSDREKGHAEDQSEGGSKSCEFRGNEVISIESAPEPCHGSKYNGLTGHSPLCLKKSTKIDSIRSRSSARKVSGPDSASSILEKEWHARSISDLNTRGYESRACDMSMTRDTQGQQPRSRASRIVDASRKIDFHDIELFVESENSTMTNVYIERNAAPQSSHPHIIDVHTMQYGHDYVIDLEAADAGQGLLFFKTEQKDSAIKWLKLKWKCREYGQ